MESPAHWSDQLTTPALMFCKPGSQLPQLLQVSSLKLLASTGTFGPPMPSATARLINNDERADAPATNHNQGQPGGIIGVGAAAQSVRILTPQEYREKYE